MPAPKNTSCNKAEAYMPTGAYLPGARNACRRLPALPENLSQSIRLAIGREPVMLADACPPGACLPGAYLPCRKNLRQSIRPAIRRKPICPQALACREPVMLADACPPGAYLPLVQNLSQSIRLAIGRKPICPQALACCPRTLACQVHTCRLSKI